MSNTCTSVDTTYGASFHKNIGWIKLCEISIAIGTPLIIDTSTQNCTFGHYMRDLDLSRRIFHEIMVEMEGFAFNMEFAYEWLLDALRLMCSAKRYIKSCCKC